MTGEEDAEVERLVDEWEDDLDMTEEEFDRAFAEGEPVEIVLAPDFRVVRD